MEKKLNRSQVIELLCLPDEFVADFEAAALPYWGHLDFEQYTGIAYFSGLSLINKRNLDKI